MTAPPSQLGDYLRGAAIGAGGMGAVYRARHVITGAEYALKLLPPSPDAELAQRFQREGLALAALDGHPNVVRVHTAGEEQGWSFLVQELIDGRDLADRLREGPLQPEEARRLVLEVGRGLAYAHAHGILHRDLKPANVLLSTAGTPRLVDFGLAQVADGRSLTKTGTVLGSPCWMSPEQARGEPTDVRSDVYGLGAILYHCLAGRPPAAGGSVLAVLDQVVSSEPPRPRELAPSVPAELEAVCLRAIAKRPADRFASVEALLEALQAPPDLRRRSWLPLVATATVLTAALAIAVTRGSGDPATGLPAAVSTAPPPPLLPAADPAPPAVPASAAGDPDDVALWRAARAGVAEACTRLGLGLLRRKRPADAARWLKRGGQRGWQRHRPAVEQAWRAETPQDPGVLLHMARVLLRPPGVEYATQAHHLTDDLHDRAWAKRVLERLQKRARQQRAVERRGRKLLAGLARKDNHRPQPAFSELLARERLEISLLTTKDRPTVQRARLRLARFCEHTSPKRAIEQYAALLEAERLVVDGVSRAQLLDALIRLLLQAPPDVAADHARALRELYLPEALQAGGKHTLAYVHGLLKDPARRPSGAALEQLRESLSDAFVENQDRVRPRRTLALLIAESHLIPPEADPGLAQEALLLVVEDIIRKRDGRWLAPVLEVWIRTLPPEARGSHAQALEAAGTRFPALKRLVRELDLTWLEDIPDDTPDDIPDEPPPDVEEQED